MSLSRIAWQGAHYHGGGVGTRACGARRGSPHVRHPDLDHRVRYRRGPAAHHAPAPGAAAPCRPCARPGLGRTAARSATAARTAGSRSSSRLRGAATSAPASSTASAARRSGRPRSRTCKAAVRYLRAHADELGLDPERIGAWGASAGGHLVAMLGVAPDRPELEGSGGWAEHSSRVQAVCDFYGPSDLLAMTDQPSALDHNDADSPEGQAAWWRGARPS